MLSTRACYVSGMCLVCFGMFWGMSLVRLWYASGMLWCVGYVLGMLLVCSWYVVGMCLVCFWYVFGVCLVCFGMFLVCFVSCSSTGSETDRFPKQLYV